MRAMRFMSAKEFLDFLNGKELFNNADHKANGAHTNSRGFCFLDADEFTPDEAFHFLSGIVSSDICVIFETKAKMTKGTGFFSDHSKPLGHKKEVAEYSVRRYSQRTHTVEKFATNFFMNFKAGTFERVFDFKTLEDIQSERT